MKACRLLLILAEFMTNILEKKKSRCRYKDYILKLCVKRKLQELISRGIIKSDEDIIIEICIDEQLTAQTDTTV